MQKLRTIKISDLLSSIFIAFLLMSIIFLLFNQNISLVDISTITLNLLWIQILVFVGLFCLIFCFHIFIKRITFLPFIIFIYASFVFIFMINIDVYAYLVGAMVMMIPMVFINSKEMIKKGKHFLHMYSLNSVLFVAIIIYFLFNINGGSIIDQVSGSQSAQIYEKYILYTLPIILVFLALFFFNRFKKNQTDTKAEIILIIFITLFEVISLSSIMVARTKMLWTSSYDFGIFAQMFYNMKNFDGMLTTIERSVMLSHNAVHFSPIYYLMLPIYMLFPSLETLQVLQVGIVAIGVIPIYLIGKHFNLNRTIIVIAIALYVYHPAIISSSFYDLHENCFLAPMLLFVLYYGLKQKWIGLVITTILTLLIKEDAGLYLVFIGLFFLFSNDYEDKNRKMKHMIMSIILILIPLIYFKLITDMLNAEGDGAMFWRYSDLMAYDQFDIFGLPLTLFQNPGYWLTTMFDPSKIFYLLVTLFMLGFIPLLNKRFSHYILLLPLLIINFSSNWQYQAMFGYQYFYGTVALLIFMFLLAFRDNQKQTIEHHPVIPYSLSIGLLVIILAIGITFLNSKSYYIDYYQADREVYDEMRETLFDIPEDASVIASGYFTPYLSNRSILYDINYYSLGTSDITFDYVILDGRYVSESTINMVISNGYIQDVSQSSSNVLIFIPNQ